MNISDAVFSILADCAARGARCPTAAEFYRQHGISAAHVLLEDLAKRGKIIVKVHARNWRVVEILAGPHKGKSTRLPPAPWAFYKIADRNGYHRVDQ